MAVARAGNSINTLSRLGEGAPNDPSAPELLPKDRQISSDDFDYINDYFFILIYRVVCRLAWAVGILVGIMIYFLFYV